MNKKFAATVALLAVLSPVLAQEPEPQSLVVIDLGPRKNARDSASRPLKASATRMCSAFPTWPRTL